MMSRLCIKAFLRNGHNNLQKTQRNTKKMTFFAFIAFSNLILLGSRILARLGKMQSGKSLRPLQNQA